MNEPAPVTPDRALDVPMSLGDHLHELRRRLILPLIVLLVCFVAAFSIHPQLKTMFAWPVLRAIELAGHEQSLAAGMPIDGSTKTLFQTLSLMESMWVSLSVAFWSAFAVALPVLIYQLWRFVSVGLLAKERSFGLLLVPVGVICFYIGATAGYFFGLPWFYAWCIEWQAGDPISVHHLRLTEYLDNFLFYTVCFGLAFDIPWGVAVLSRVGLATPEGLRKHRKMVFIGCTVFAAIVAPPDGFSMLAMMFPCYALYEVGILWASIDGWSRRRRSAPPPG
jgi:sec-independent protein translocase protein TatC